MILSLSLFTIFSVALLVGTEFAVSAFVNPVLWKLDPPARADATRRFAALLGKVMPIWYALDFVLLVIEAFDQRRHSGLPEIIAACTLWAAAILASVLWLVPINNRMIQLRPESPSGTALSEHKQWDALHRVRVSALCLAFLAFLFGVFRS
ncbi:MAG TPA: DUF1772 domain-containing protein [Terracidiphilus sp.]|jgi:hypothetical protein